MDLSRQEYPAMLASLQPSQAIDVLNDRVRQVGHLNSNVADWLQERRRLEEQYSAGLRKLARRPAVGDPSELGVFSTPWSSLVNALETLADSHHALAQKIETDVEKPLRDFAVTNREMQAMTTIQGNLASMARDIEGAQKKSERLQTKGNKAMTNKVANASSDLENAQAQWDSQAPYVFENLQAVDETRLNHMRDCLTQFQTHEVDLVERNRVSAEGCLNVLLNVETADEIKTFALRTVSGKARVERTRSRQSIAQPSPSTPNFSASTGSASAITGGADDSLSQRSGSVSELSTPKPEKAKGGLRRLGTVLSRRRESKIPAGADRIADSPEVRAKSSGNSAFSSFASRRGRVKEMPPVLEPPQEEARERPRSPLRTISSISDVSAPPGPPPGRREQPTVNGTAELASPSTPNVTNGNHQPDITQLQEPLRPSAPPEPSRKDSEGFSQRPADIDPIAQAELEASQSSTPQFNVNIRDAPATQEEGDVDVLTSMASTLKMQAPPTAAARRAGTVRGRRDNRASVYAPNMHVAPEPVLEASPPVETREAEPQAPAEAPSPVFPPESAPAPSSSVFPSPVAQATPTFPPFAPAAVAAGGGAGFLAGSIGGASQSAGFAPLRPGSSAQNLAAEPDNQSIRSGRSLASTNSLANKHPDLSSPGLNTSIIETVSAWFEDGACTRSVVIGELALAYSASDFAATLSSETIRLDNFAALDKVAPNPSFLTPTDRAGEYRLSLSQISKTQVGFKYQVQTNASSPGSHAPLLITPAWRIEDKQTSVIVSYALNPSYELRGRTSLRLSNVVLVLHLEGAKAASCMSKPQGTFSKERNCIFWQLGDVTLSAGEPAKKMLARFATETAAQQGKVEARWELGGQYAAGAGSGLGVSVREGEGGAGAGAATAGASSVEDDPFSDESARAAETAGWREVRALRKIVGGTYSAV